MQRHKTVKEKKELYIEFTEDEIAEMGWEPNQKLTIAADKDGDITIKPWVKVDIDMTGWPKEIFEMLVETSLEEDKTVNQVIVDLLEDSLKHYSDGYEV
jgi:hypothetical protein